MSEIVCPVPGCEFTVRRKRRRSARRVMFLTHLFSHPDGWRYMTEVSRLG